MDVDSSSGASSSDVLASGSGAATAGGVFCFGAGGFSGFGSLALQIAATSAGRSSGGARATDAISAAVGLTSPESTFCRVPGTASSAASTPFANCSARITVFRPIPFSEAILSQVRFSFWLLPFWYYTYPDDWTDSFYGVRDALSNLLTYGSNGNQVTAKDRAAAKASYAALQQEIMADYADMKAAVAAADTLEAKQAAATNASNAMSQKVYNTTLKMYNKLQAKTAARAWVSSLLH